jgi:hypothetical protein
MSYPPEGQNPYSSPQAQGMVPRATTPGIPTFSKVMFILDLVFCGLRVPLAMLSIIGMSVIPPNHPLYPTVLFEVATNVAIAVLGLPANILCLMRKPMGVWLGVMALLAVGGNVAVGAWQLSLQGPGGPFGNAQAGAVMIGAMIGMLVRVGINIAWVVALVQFNVWLKSLHTSDDSFGPPHDAGAWR